jgi:hypothetical protein
MDSRILSLCPLKRGNPIYGLDRYRLSERRLELFNEIRRLVEKGRISFQTYVDTDGKESDGINEVVHQLKVKIDKESEFSAASYAYMRGLRSTNDVWLDSVVI